MRHPPPPTQDAQVFYLSSIPIYLSIYLSVYLSTYLPIIFKLASNDLIPMKTQAQSPRGHRGNGYPPWHLTGPYRAL